MEKYIAYGPGEDCFEKFETFEDAQEWILEKERSERFVLDFRDGLYFIAEITHVSAFRGRDYKDREPYMKSVTTE